MFEVRCNKCDGIIKLQLSDEHYKILNNPEKEGRFIFKLSCSCNKKENELLIEKYKFQILFDMGIQSMLLGYFREAISDFAASCERFYEYFLYNVFDNDLIDKIKFNKAWKDVSSQSERQLGAFIFIHLFLFNEVFEISKKMIELRNKAIHKGKFINKEECITYAKYVYCIIYNALDKLNKYYIKNEIVDGNFQVSPRFYPSECFEQRGNYNTWISFIELYELNDIRAWDTFEQKLLIAEQNGLLDPAFG